MTDPLLSALERESWTEAFDIAALRFAVRALPYLLPGLSPDGPAQVAIRASLAAPLSPEVAWASIYELGRLTEAAWWPEGTIMAEAADLLVSLVALHRQTSEPPLEAIPGDPRQAYSMFAQLGIAVGGGVARLQAAQNEQPQKAAAYDTLDRAGLLRELNRALKNKKGRGAAVAERNRQISAGWQEAADLRLADLLKLTPKQGKATEYADLMWEDQAWEPRPPSYGRLYKHVGRRLRERAERK